MSENHNRLSQFWQELKRRKVVRVITVYAAAAFVILELVDIISPNLGLPTWTFNLVLILLCVGFIIAVILSWIYDIHPEGGIVKTEPVHTVGPGEQPGGSNSWRIASYISFVVIVLLIVLNIIPRTGKKWDLDKSIAVLPFRNESSDDENTYFINGMMESILDKLCRIEDLRVISRNSVETYRNEPKPTPVVADEMNVSYILVGSGQKMGNRLLLTIQLIAGTEDHQLWSKQYDREIEKVEDLIDIQKEIAHLVTEEIEAIITPEEKERINKTPTTSLAAYDYYQKGNEEYADYRYTFGNVDALNRAENYYKKALEYDTSFALAYTGLASVYWSKYYFETYYTAEFLDSILDLCDIAISFDDQVAESYIIRGNFYYEIGDPEKAVEEYDRALKLNPNHWEAWYGKARVYHNNDLLQCIKYNLKAVSMNRGSELPYLLKRLGTEFVWAGFVEKGYEYCLEALNLDGDSASYFYRLLVFERWNRDYKKAIQFGENAFLHDSTIPSMLVFLGSSYIILDQHEKALEYINTLVEVLNTYPDRSIQPGSEHRIGYIFWKNGYKEEADYYLNKALDYSYKQIKLGRRMSQQLMSYYDIAAGHAFRGERKKAYENLRIFNQKPIMPIWASTLMKDDPLFDNIRDEPEFQQIVRDVEAKYQAEHERVRKWLEENDML